MTAGISKICWAKPTKSFYIDTVPEGSCLLEYLFEYGHKVKPSHNVNEMYKRQNFSLAQEILECYYWDYDIWVAKK
jgi:hypothetical protein